RECHGDDAADVLRLNPSPRYDRQVSHPGVGCADDDGSLGRVRGLDDPPGLREAQPELLDGSPEAACSGYGSVPHPVEQAISWNIDRQACSAWRRFAPRILRPEDDGDSSLTHEKPHRERAADPSALARNDAAWRAGVGLARARTGWRGHDAEVGGAVHQASGGGRNARGIPDDVVADGP